MEEVKERGGIMSITNEQAIEFLEKEKGYYTNSSIYMNRVMNNTEKGSSLYKKIKYLELAINALEKQIPRKMTKDNMWMICPNCGTSYYIFEVEKYCDICGQKLGAEE